MSSTFPHHPEKHRGEPVVPPEVYRRHVQERHGVDDLSHLAGCILLYQGRLARDPQVAQGLTPVPGWRDGELGMLATAGRTVGVRSGFGMGAPAVTLALEQLVALGVRRFVTVGTAGALRADLAIGDAFLCDGAIRDDGVSHHYLPPERTARPTSELTERVARTASTTGPALRRGTVWTTDAPLRETREEVRDYGDEGVLGVDMEAAAVFAVARHRSVAAAALFVVSDSLAAPEWRPGFRDEVALTSLRRCFGTAVDSLVAE